jgi:hypothetical protein
MSVIAIDFDDTLMNTQNVQSGYRMGRPISGAILATQRLMTEGNQIVIFTARDVQKPSVYKSVEDWLKYFQIPFNGITNIKRPEFDIIIDNRALHFNSWPQVISDIKKFTDQKLVNNDISQPSPLIEDITQPLS